MPRRYLAKRWSGVSPKQFLPVILPVSLKVSAVDQHSRKSRSQPLTTVRGQVYHSNLWMRQKVLRWRREKVERKWKKFEIGFIVVHWLNPPLLHQWCLTLSFSLKSEVTDVLLGEHCRAVTANCMDERIERESWLWNELQHIDVCGQEWEPRDLTIKTPAERCDFKSMIELVPGARTEEGEEQKVEKHRQISDDSQPCVQDRPLRDERETERERKDKKRKQKRESFGGKGLAFTKCCWIKLCL